MKAFTPLYKRTKTGAIQEWRVWSDADKVYTEWGQQNGAKQTSTTVATPTNEGKANERNANEQADFDAGSLWRNKVDKGYVEDPKDAKEQIVFLPMLAHTLKDATKLTTLVNSVYIQPKLDGVRCLAYLEDGEVQLMSRGGKPYFVPHIATELKGVLDEFTVLDGELYIEGKSCQDITSYVKKYKAGSEKLILRVFDIVNTAVPTEPFSNRAAKLFSFFYDNKLTTVEMVSTMFAPPYELEKYHARFIEDGLEGTIIRLPEGVYEWGARSRDLLKYKSFDEEDFKALSVRAGLGKLSKAGIFTCANDKTKAVFDVVFAGTIEEREDHLTNQNDYIGKLLSVKHFGRTNDGLPRFPVGIAFKEDR
jgi:DNA ligase-1